MVAFVSFYQGQAKAFETAPLAATQGLDAKSKAVPLRSSPSLDKLPPGQYVGLKKYIQVSALAENTRHAGN
jgi:hypothetical protein